MVKHPSKFRLLLDEMFPGRENFPELNNLHNLRSIVHDSNLGGVTDERVALTAKKRRKNHYY